MCIAVLFRRGGGDTMHVKVYDYDELCKSLMVGGSPVPLVDVEIHIEHDLVDEIVERVYHLPYLMICDDGKCLHVYSNFMDGGKDDETT